MSEPAGAPSDNRIRNMFESKADYITRVLRQQIFEGTLGPGAELRQRDIAAMFDVSPTPVREALSRLSAEGYVTMRLHQGASVVRSAIDRRQENWRIRARLESLAAEMAAERLEPGDMEQISSLAEAFASADDETERHLANRAFHFQVYKSARSPVLLRFLEELWRALDVAPSAYRAHEVSAAQHFEIVEALRSGDAQRAAELTYAHISETVAGTVGPYGS